MYIVTVLLGIKHPCTFELGRQCVRDTLGEALDIAISICEDKGVDSDKLLESLSRHNSWIDEDLNFAVFIGKGEE